MSEISGLDYMQQVKLSCGFFDDCTMKNPVNCRRCIKAVNLQKKLLEKMGLKGEMLETSLNFVRSVANLSVPQTSKNYWCFKCGRNHEVNSKIGKTHAREIEGDDKSNE